MINNSNKFLEENKYVLLSFIFPFILISTLFLNGIYPFGENALCPYDSFPQYITFLRTYKEIILNNESIFFSLKASSTDFYLIWLYYLVSPFNLIVLFIEDTIIAFYIIFILKICLIGLSFSLYLKKTFKYNRLSLFVFSMGYTLSSYVSSYYFSIMWLDILIIFPWLIYSYKLMLKNKKIYLYPLMLCLCIFSNFFISIHICVILSVYFIIDLILNMFIIPKKESLKKLIRFSSLSILGGLMSSVFFIPFLSIAGEKIRDIVDFKLLTSFQELFMSFCTMSEKNISMKYDSNANIYCGIVVFIFFIRYFFEKRIDIIDKIKNLFITIFIFLCLNISTLDFFVNGFYKTTGYMGRYSYILIFFILTCSYESFLLYKRKKELSLYKSVIIASFLFLLSFICMFITKSTENEEFISITATFLIIVLTFFAIYFKKLIKNKKQFFCLVLIIELSSTFLYNFPVKDTSDSLENIKIYEEIKIETNNRSSIDKKDFSNEEEYLGLNPLSIFSSTLNKNTTSSNYNLGMYGGSNFFTTVGHSPVIDMLYNIEMAYSNTNEDYYNFEEIENKSGLASYKNKYNTSYAYIMPKTVEIWDCSEKNPFLNINLFVGYYFSEHSSNTYVYDMINSENIAINSNIKNIARYDGTDFKIKFKKDDSEKDNIISFSTISKKDNICFNIDSSFVEKVKIYQNDKQIKYYTSNISGRNIYVDEINENDSIKIELILKSSKKEGSINFNMAYFNKENFNKFAKSLENNILPVKIKGNNVYIEDVIPNENNIVFVSMFYDKNWKSENVEFNKDFPFLSFDANKTSYILTYKNNLFNISLAMSSIFFTIWVILLLYLLKKNRQKS